MWGVVIIMLAPLGWEILTSLKPDAETTSFPPTIMPIHPSLANYVDLFRVMQFGDFYVNTLEAAGLAALLTVCLGAPAAYAMVRFKIPGSDLLGSVGLVAYMIPAIVVVVPIFRVAYGLHALDSLSALVVLYTLAYLPFAVWQLRSAFAAIPVELELVALVDGATRLETFLFIALPLAVPALAAMAIFVFAASWSEYLFASLLLVTPSHQTLSPGLSIALLGQLQLYSWGDLMAGSTLMTVPVIALFALAQRRFVMGLTAGAIVQ